MTIEPCSGLSRPPSDFRKTDLPVPDGPRRTEISPGGKVRVTSLQMFWLPKDFDQPTTSTATPAPDCAAPALPPPPRPRCRLPPPLHRGATAVCCVVAFRASRNPSTSNYS